ncbi:hypothetical protein KR222_009940 [Zaprionus bogoriensis]|nr:hypothetical protein KR222_009940 [Zaprionus bogoriensis]
MKPSAALANGNDNGDNDDGDGDEQQSGDHFEGDPRPLPYAFEKELIDKSNRHIRVCEVFAPSNKVHPISCKFYARAEQQAPQAAQRHRHSKLAADYPLLESQSYGWIPQQCREAAGYLNRVHAPKRRCRMTTHGEQLIAGRITERPPFNGLQFILH